MTSCKTCKFYQDAAIFELCLRPEASYKVDGAKTEQQHTVSHMRLHACREPAVLYLRKL
jgi:hypothetical protein